MRRPTHVIGLALATALGLAAPAALAAEHEPVSRPTVTSVHQAPLPGVEGKEIVIKHFSIPPGFVGTRHTHRAPVYVYVLEGELTVETARGVETYGVGEIYAEPLNHPMQGKNLRTSEDLRLLVIQVGDIGQPMMNQAD